MSHQINTRLQTAQSEFSNAFAQIREREGHIARLMERIGHLETGFKNQSTIFGSGGFPPPGGPGGPPPPGGDPWWPGPPPSGSDPSPPNENPRQNNQSGGINPGGQSFGAGNARSSFQPPAWEIGRAHV